MSCIVDQLSPFYLTTHEIEVLYLTPFYKNRSHLLCFLQMSGPVINPVI